MDNIRKKFYKKLNNITSIDNNIFIEELKNEYDTLKSIDKLFVLFNTHKESLDLFINQNFNLIQKKIIHEKSLYILIIENSMKEKNINILSYLIKNKLVNYELLDEIKNEKQNLFTYIINSFELSQYKKKFDFNI